MGSSPSVGLLGASSLVGSCLKESLVAIGLHTFAFSRRAFSNEPEAGITWIQLDASTASLLRSPIVDWVCVAPIWVLPNYLPMIEASGARRVVALSSTSRFTKLTQMDSADLAENAIARQLAEGEESLRSWARRSGVEYVILRPTMIYGLGRDKNVAEMSHFIRRFGFFPLLGSAMGLRQPIHAMDVAAACVSALTAAAAGNHEYNVSGGETLPYREMIECIFFALKQRRRLITIPLPVFKLAIWFMRFLPKYRHWSASMAERMNRDLVFDHTPAARDLGFAPRPFQLTPHDVSR